MSSRQCRGGSGSSPCAAVITTVLAGVVLCEPRRRSGSLLAPIGLHWAINALGYVAALVATRWRGGT